MTHNTGIRSYFWQAINAGIKANLIPLITNHRQYFLARANRALKRCIADPGDCANDPQYLAALAVAEAQVGRSAGWIPEVQRLAALLCK